MCGSWRGLHYKLPPLKVGLLEVKPLRAHSARYWWGYLFEGQQPIQLEQRKLITVFLGWTEFRDIQVAAGLIQAQLFTGQVKAALDQVGIRPDAAHQAHHVCSLERFVRRQPFLE